MVDGRGGGWGEVFKVIRRNLQTWRPRTILDVGANIGDTTEVFAERFPQARIHALEPVPATYFMLQERAGSLRQVRCHQVALSDHVARVWMEVPDDTKLSRIVATHLPGQPGLEVRTTTGDAFCADAGISAVDFLKIDTEGHDLHVLRGFEAMLGRQRIGLLDVEVGLTADNDRHVPLSAVQDHLAARGYLPFWLHDRTMDLWFNGRPVLRRVNVVFIAQTLVEANRIEPRVLTALREGAEEP